MATTNTPTTIASRLKEIYPDGITQLVPKCNELVGKRLKFRKDLQQGEKVRFDVQLGLEQGFSMGTGDVTLNGAVAQSSEKAEVSGYSIILQSNVSYDAITRAQSTKQAFAKFNSDKYIPTAESFRTRQEILAMYGRRGLGTVTSNTGGTNETLVVITAGTWCPAVWLTLKNATLEAWTAVAGSGSQHDGDLVLSKVAISTRTLYITAAANAYTNIAQNDIIFLKNQRSAAPYGLMDIAYNTGTLYNISAATHELWKANAYDVGTSALTIGKVLAASALAADKGCAEDMTCFVSNKTFQSLINDQSALREYGASYNSAEFENGAERIAFHGACGKVTIVPYMFCQDGFFLMFCEKYCYLIGSEEMTNNIGQSGDIYFDLESTSSKQIRFFSDYTVFCEKPAFMVYGVRSDGLALHT